MKIALTGSSSTGKTTLANELMKSEMFAELVGEFIFEDARSLLRSLGHKSMDDMSRIELRRFQEAYLKQKSENEVGRNRFLVDRSFADVAAYWLVRDSFDLSYEIQEAFARQCRELALSYDLHVYFPLGQIPFDADGYRSENQDFHERIGSKIHELLNDWGMPYLTIESQDLEARVQQVLAAVLSEGSY